MQLGPDTFDDSRLVKTFPTILEATELSSSFRFAPEEKTSKKIPESSRLKKFVENNFA